MPASRMSSSPGSSATGRKCWHARNRRIHCKDWLYFKLTGERVCRSFRSQFHLRQLSHPQLCARHPRCARRCRSQAPPAPIVEGTEQSHGLSLGSRGQPPGCCRHAGQCSAMSMSSAPGLAAACSTARASRLHDRRLDRHAYAACASRRPRSSSIAERTGYTMAFPAPGMYGADAVQHGVHPQYRLAARSRTRCARRAKVSSGRARICWKAWTTGSWRGPPAGCSIIPISRMPASAVPFSSRGAGAVHRPRDRHGLCRSHARRVRRPVLCGARLLRGHGAIPKEISLTGGGGALQGAAADLASALDAPVRSVAREEAGAAGAAMMAAVQQKVYPEHGGLCCRNGSIRCSDPRPKPDAGLAKHLRHDIPDLSRDARPDAHRLARACRRARQGVPCVSLSIIGDLFMRSDMFEQAIRERCPQARTRHPRP